MDVKIILSIVGALISLAAVVLIYNARKIVRERFSFGDQNSGTLAVKTIGMVLFCVGMLFFRLLHKLTREYFLNVLMFCLDQLTRDSELKKMFSP